MATEKMLPCCARLQSRLTHEEANKRRLAKRIAYYGQRGGPISQNLRQELANAKGSVTDLLEQITDHEAEHAGQEAQDD